MHRAAAAVLVLVAMPLVVRAQVPAGPEFLVNTYTTGIQTRPAVASDVLGNLVVTWDGPSPGGFGSSVFGQRFDASGTARGSEFRVNTNPAQNLYGAAVASDAHGDFVVIWQAPFFEGAFDVFGRRFDASATPRGAEFRVNTYLTDHQRRPVVASDALGNFVVAWQGEDMFLRSDIWARRYDAAGAPRSVEFRVNTDTAYLKIRPALASDPNGNFVAVWNGFEGSYEARYGVFAQLYDGSGQPRGTEFLVNTFTIANQLAPAVASDRSGNFVVIWESRGQDGAGDGVFGQRFDAAGTPRGSEFRVNSFTPSYQRYPGVASDAEGNFVVIWESRDQDGSSYGVFGQRFTAAGAPRGGEFQVNTYTTGFQRRTAVASDAVGNFVVIWAGATPAPSSSDVFARRFGGLLPAAATVDSTGNRVLEPGETVDVRPSWRNVNGAPQTFAAVLGSITGPPGGTYSIMDGAGDYGPVASGATAACVDCFAVAVSAPPMRPATHWDASAVEAITPDAQGQRKRWLLHIGNSFTDVPASSTFYPFVETLLHHSITGGCGAAEYCPASSTTREQMAVFVLVAREGAGYAPPACATPVFNDVPASSPFCRWIEELARRGVVSGCGGGNYCPADSVTREQMAVFALRTLEPALDPPACATPVFADVPASSPFCRWIEELARRGVVGGCGGGNYCPLAAVTREQMGVFVSVTFALTLYGV